MATAVVQYAECLKPHRRSSTMIPHRRKPPYLVVVRHPPQSNSWSKPLPRFDGGKPSIRHQTVAKASQCQLVMEEVKLLKRGEETRPLFAAATAAVDSSPPAVKAPEILTNKMWNSLYAGPGFVTSPSPSSVPFPSSILKKRKMDGS